MNSFHEQEQRAGREFEMAWAGEEEGESILPETCSPDLWYKPGLQVAF